MRISIHTGSVIHSTPDQTLADIERCGSAGLDGFWAPMLNGLDTLTMLALAGTTVPRIDLGTAVVPIPLRSPFALAQQVRTVQAVTGGRLVLGLGTSHQRMVEHMFGGDWHPPIHAMQAFLDELIPLLADGGPVAAGVSVAPPPILLGGINPAMAALAAERTDGVVLWAAGRQTLEQVVLPAASQHHGIDPFRIVVILPFMVTDDVAAGRALIQSRFGVNDNLPSYRKVLDREGAVGVGDLAIVGNEHQIRQQLDEFAALGVTEFAGSLVTQGNATRDWNLLSELAAAA